MLRSSPTTHHNKAFINFPWLITRRICIKNAFSVVFIFHAYVGHMKKVIICELKLISEYKSYAMVAYVLEIATHLKEELWM